MKLTTDFIKVGQSGPTCDGREIDAQWLREAAETYDPKVYAALIWPEHFRFLGNSGKVVALKAKDEGDGIVGLYAQLEPNVRLLQSIKEGQRLYTSMELTPDFAGTGKHYLAGLGVTDSPASLGTDELKFSKRAHAPGNKFYAGVELGQLEAEAEGEEEAATLLKRLFHLLGFGGKGAAPAQEPEQHEENNVDKEQFDALNGALAGLTAKVEELGDKFTAQGAEGKQPEPEAPTPAPEEKADASKEIFGKLEALTDSVIKLTQRMEAAAPGTPAAENSGPADLSGDVM